MRFTATILLIILFIWGGTSCRKEYTIKVKVYNPITGEAYANNDISIREEYSNVGGGFNSPTEYDIIFTGTTDENGTLIITEKFHKNRHYTITSSQPGGPNGTCYVNSSGNSLFKDGEGDKEVFFEYVPCSELKLIFNNINCSGASDSIFYQRIYLEYNDSTGGVSQSGCFSYDGDYFDVPMGNYKYLWNVTRNGQTTYHDTTFYIPENGQYTLEINY